MFGKEEEEGKVKWKKMQSLSSSSSISSLLVGGKGKGQVGRLNKKTISITCVYTPSSVTKSNNNNNMSSSSAAKWAQKTITLPPHNRGCHLITPKVRS